MIGGKLGTHDIMAGLEEPLNEILRISGSSGLSGGQGVRGMKVGSSWK